jgi:hypothetical protein
MGNIKEFASRHRTGLITLGVIAALIGGGEYYDRTRQELEGEVIEASITGDRDSRIILRTKEKGDITLTVDTAPKALYIGIYGHEFSDKVGVLKESVTKGSRLKVRTCENDGLVREVYDFLGKYK